MNLILAFIALAFSFISTDPMAQKPSQVTAMPPSETEVVVLLHGIAMSPFSMRWMARDVQAAGFVTINHGYPSRNMAIGELVDNNLAPLIDSLKQQGYQRIHFVTHSMGGILVRDYAARYGSASIGRVVMLAPPNSGSELADHLRHIPLYRSYFGPAGQQLGTQSFALPAPPEPPPFECAVIAGRLSLNPLANRWISGPSDGTVSVQSTQMPGMKAFSTVNTIHALIQAHPQARKQTVEFLKDGRFTNPKG